MIFLIFSEEFVKKNSFFLIVVCDSFFFLGPAPELHVPMRRQRIAVLAINLLGTQASVGRFHLALNPPPKKVTCVLKRARVQITDPPETSVLINDHLFF